VRDGVKVSRPCPNGVSAGAEADGGTAASPSPAGLWPAGDRRVPVLLGDFGRAGGKRLAPFLPELVTRLRACGELNVDDDVAAALSRIGAAPSTGGWRPIAPSWLPAVDHIPSRVRYSKTRSRSAPGSIGTKASPGPSRSTWSAMRAGSAPGISARR